MAKSDKQNKGELRQLNNFVLFTAGDGKVNIDVYFQDETLWLPQKSIAELSEKGRSTITKHLKKIFEDGELDEKVVCRKFRHTTQHGGVEGLTQEKEVKFYNLKAITAVGYRVNSHRAIEFRKWATTVLHEYIIKGFAIDDERLKQIQHFGIDSDLAKIYRIETELLNEQVKRNKDRFPADFMFHLTKEEREALKSQIATSKSGERGNTTIGE